MKATIKGSPRRRAWVLVLAVSLIAAVALATVAQGSPAAHAAATCSDYPNQAAAQRAADTRDPDSDGVFCVIAPLPLPEAR